MSTVKNLSKKLAIPWWYWMWGIHILLVGSLYLYMFTPYKTDWFKLMFPTISLGQEENYAVWWSGICLFIASSLFYKIASANPTLKSSWKWGVLSLAMLALAFDEIGSLHEVVSKFGGWEALIPFALIFIVGFMAALFVLVRTPGYRIAAVLIFLGIALFASVALLEFVEHNLELTNRQQRRRLLIEEGVELFAMSLIIIAGLISMKREGITQRSLSEVIGNTRQLFFHPTLVFALFGIQFVAISGFAVPHAGMFSEGNPASVFPIFMYYILSMMCIHIGHVQRNYVLWWGFAGLFLFTSLCQILSVISLILRLQFNFYYFLYPPSTWMVTLIPMAVLCAVFLFNRWISLRKLIPELILVFCVIIFLYPDNHSYMVYFLFSSCTALFCYRLLNHYVQSLADE